MLSLYHWDKQNSWQNVVSTETFPEAFLPKPGLIFCSVWFVQIITTRGGGGGGSLSLDKSYLLI